MMRRQEAYMMRRQEAEDTKPAALNQAPRVRRRKPLDLNMTSGLCPAD